jgi:hypothetical protein
MAKRYIKIGWENKPSVKTPVNMANLGRMDKGIDDCDNAIEEIYNKRVNNVVTTNEDTFLAGPVGKVLQDQVTELNKNMQFEDWKTATLQNEWTGAIKYSKNGYGFVKLWIHIVPGVLTGLTVVANIPSSYRPEGNISIQLISTEGKKANYIVYLNENGNIYLTADSNFSGVSSYLGQTLFPTL